MFWTNVAINVLLVFFVIDSVLMCLVVLMQRSKQEGLGAAFGGSITSELLGAGTSAFLVKTTVWLAAFFFILSIALAQLYNHRETLAAAQKGLTSPVQEELLHPVVPAKTNAAPTVPTATTPATPSSVPANAPASTPPAKSTK